jgi:hypothetical protein
MGRSLRATEPRQGHPARGALFGKFQYLPSIFSRHSFWCNRSILNCFLPHKYWVPAMAKDGH